MSNAPAPFEFHPAANLFAVLPDNQLDKLADDIAANGLLTPIQLCEGKIIDGRNRYKACLLRNPKAIRTIEVNPADPVAYVLSLNMHRRHLTETQKSLVAAKAEEVYKAKAKQRQRGGQGGVLLKENLPEATGQARDQAGAAVGVSGKSVDYASAVLKNGSPKLVEACEKGQVAISSAAKLAELPKKKQDAIIEAGKKSGNVKKFVASAVNKTSTQPASKMPRPSSIESRIPVEVKDADIIEVWRRRDNRIGIVIKLLQEMKPFELEVVKQRLQDIVAAS